MWKSFRYNVSVTCIIALRTWRMSLVTLAPMFIHSKLYRFFKKKPSVLLQGLHGDSTEGFLLKNLHCLECRQVYTSHFYPLHVGITSAMKLNKSGFRPPLCTYRLNWARRTSCGWWDDWDDTVLQTQDSKFEPWRSEVEHATSRSRRLPAILTFTCEWGWFF